MWLMSITASNPVVGARGAEGAMSGRRDAVCRAAQPVMAGTAKPLPNPPSTVLREIIEASFIEAKLERNRI